MLNVLDYIDIPHQVRDEWEYNLLHSEKLQKYETPRTIKWIEQVKIATVEYLREAERYPMDSPIVKKKMHKVGKLTYHIWKHSKYLEMKVAEYEFSNN